MSGVISSLEDDAHGDVHGDVHGDAHGDVHGDAHDDAHGDVHDDAHGDAHGNVHAYISDLYARANVYNDERGAEDVVLAQGDLGSISCAQFDPLASLSTLVSLSISDSEGATLPTSMPAATDVFSAGAAPTHATPAQSATAVPAYIPRAQGQTLAQGTAAASMPSPAPRRVPQPLLDNMHTARAKIAAMQQEIVALEGRIQALRANIGTTQGFLRGLEACSGLLAGGVDAPAPAPAGGGRRCGTPGCTRLH